MKNIQEGVKHTIDKSFSFCYGHRVHNQRLDTNFTESGCACLACRHLHGHEGLVKVYIEEIITGENIKEIGMVTDFKHLGWFRNFIDDTLDHKFIMDLQDPLFTEEFELMCDQDGGNIVKDGMIQMHEGHYIPNMKYVEQRISSISIDSRHNEAKMQAIFEKYEGVVFVDFVPTSENIAAWLLKIAQNKMRDIPNIKVVAVEYNETPKSHCRVEAL